MISFALLGTARGIAQDFSNPKSQDDCELFVKKVFYDIDERYEEYIELKGKWITVFQHRKEEKRIRKWVDVVAYPTPLEESDLAKEELIKFIVVSLEGREDKWTFYPTNSPYTRFFDKSCLSKI